MKTTRVLILGCGWVGEEFAIQCRNQGIEVWASTTNIEKYHRLKSDGIFSFLLDFDHVKQVPDILPDTFDYILTSVPASSKNTVEAISQRFNNVLSFIRLLQYSKHIFLSSIGIYPNIDGVIDEYFGDKEALNPLLLLAEEKMTSLPQTIVFRLGGLFGKNRIFAKYFAGKICTTGNQPANFVHIQDVIQLIFLAFATHFAHRLFNIVCPEHPLKKEIIVASATKYGYELPRSFEPEQMTQKIVSSDRVIQTLEYTFLYPSPLNF
ncbi:Rossmann-fold NAD(P)-binding domain-containing protein [Sphingobacterium pedocola]|uniref:GDP-L-fucose synthase n=1 Tax=Sphingobacterium pedocola TaxID=2082722 RepID=A0ABR9T5N1_9SPHI|nr:GDP-L-fucose synthase [Sphingobacterium pedocola]MBE8720647.1 GDP-L-fucose synthase [Sphingobacterium pedocola]